MKLIIKAILKVKEQDNGQEEIQCNHLINCIVGHKNQDAGLQKDVLLDLVQVILLCLQVKDCSCRNSLEVTT